MTPSEKKDTDKGTGMDAHTNYDMAHSGPPDSSAPLSSLPLQSSHPVAPQDSYRLLESSEAPGQTAQVNLQEAVLPHAAAVSASNRSARDVRSYTMDADWKPQPDGRSYSITDVVEACVVALEHVNLDDGGYPSTRPSVAERKRKSPLALMKSIRGLSRETGMLKLSTQSPTSPGLRPVANSPVTPVATSPLYAFLTQPPSGVASTSMNDACPTAVLQLTIESLHRRGILLRKPSPCVVVHACQAETITTCAPSASAATSPSDPLPWPSWLAGDPLTCDNASVWREVGRTEGVLQQTSAVYRVTIPLPLPPPLPPQSHDTPSAAAPQTAMPTWLQFSVIDAEDETLRAKPLQDSIVLCAGICQLEDLLPIAHASTSSEPFVRHEETSVLDLVPLSSLHEIHAGTAAAKVSKKRKLDVQGRLVIKTAVVNHRLAHVPAICSLPLARCPLTISTGYNVITATEFMTETQLAVTVPLAFVRFRAEQYSIALTSSSPTIDFAVPPLAFSGDSPLAVYDNVIRSLAASFGCVVMLGSRIPWILELLAEHLSIRDSLSPLLHSLITCFGLTEGMKARQLIACNDATVAMVEVLNDTRRSGEQPSGITWSALLQTHSWFKKSVWKKQPNLAFVPTNFHLQLFRVHCYQVSHSSSVEGFVLPRRRSVSMSAAELARAVAASDEDDTIAHSRQQASLLSRQYESRSHLHSCSVTACVTMGAPVAHCSEQLVDGVVTAAQDMASASAESFTEAMSGIIERGDLIASQAITALVAAFATSATQAFGRFCADSSGGAPVMEHDWWRQIDRAGYLFHMECWLSTFGPDAPMLQDTVFAYFILHRVKLRVAWKGMDSSLTQPPDSDVGFSMSDDGLYWVATVWLFAEPRELERVPRHIRASGCIDVVPLLFTQGVNEWQTTGNMSRSNRLQHVMNAGSLCALSLYAATCHNEGLLSPSSVAFDASIAAASSPSSASPASRKLSRRATAQIGAAKPATVQDYSSSYPASVQSTYNISTLLHECWESLTDRKMEFDKNLTFMERAGATVGMLRGGKCVFCKSGKDRTGMAVTLDETSVLRHKHGVSECDAILDTLRTCGTRRLNAYKNTGSCTFAFNRLQLTQLPAGFRPPKGTATGGVT